MSSRARTAFYEELSTNLQKRQAFMADCFTNVVSSGRADQKSLTKALAESYSSLSRDDIGYKSNLSFLTKLHKDLAPSMHTIEEFARKSWNLGFDSRSDDGNHPDYDKSLIKAIVLDGVLLEYCLSSTVRQSIREIASLAWKHLQEAPYYSAGIAHLEALADEKHRVKASTDSSIKHFDRQMLSTLYLLRRACDDLFFEADEESQRTAVGPTGWVLLSVRVLALEEFIAHFPSHLWTPINQRYSEYVNKLDFREYKLADSPDLIPELRFIKALSQDLALVSRVSESKAALMVHHTLPFELPSADTDSNTDLDTTKRNVLNPPDHGIAFEQTDYQKTGLDTFVIFHGQIPTFQVVDLNEERIVRWCLDKNQDVRVGMEGFHIPFDMQDLGKSTEDFQQWREQIVHQSDILMRDLASLLIQFPGLYAGNFGASSNIAIVKDDTTLTFSCPAHQEAELRAAILESSLLGDTYEISTSNNRDLEQFIITLSVPEQTDTPRASSSNTLEHLSTDFISTYCPNYRDLLAILNRIGVTEVSGRGSHRGLCYHGRKYSTSQKLRGGTMLITRQVIEGILNQLEIPLKQFIEGATRKRSSQHNEIQPKI